MIVQFIKESNKSYGIRIDSDVGIPLEMSPAPGYDDHLPHDVLHLIVEGVLRLDDGVFGQLSQGGNASSFSIATNCGLSGRSLTRERRKLKLRSDRLSKAGVGDSSLSENGTYLVWREWLTRSASQQFRQAADQMRENATSIQSRLTPDEQHRLDESMDLMCEMLDSFSARWSSLKVGEAVSIRWPDLSFDGVT